jgi:hypothetical protein
MSDLVTNTVIALHLGSLAFAALGILLADHAAFLWMRGRDRVSHRNSLLRLHWMVTAGLTGLVLTGLYLFWPLRGYLLGQPLFWLKMTFVAALIINSFFIERFLHIAMTRSFASLTKHEKTPLFISGAVSTLSWLGAASCAILLFRWPFL